MLTKYWFANVDSSVITNTSFCYRLQIVGKAEVLGRGGNMYLIKLF
jgi:hypothetical protein